MSNVIDWILEEQNPAIRYRTMTELLDAPKRSAETDSAYREIWEAKDVQKMLARQNAHGVWEHSKKEYGVHTSLRYLNAFAENGLRRDERLDQAVRYAIECFAQGKPMDPGPGLLWVRPCLAAARAGYAGVSRR